MRTLPTICLCLGLCLAAPAWAQAGPAPGGAPDPAAKRAAARVEDHITELKRRLTIGSAQQPQWEAFADVLRRNAQGMEQAYRERQARGPLSAVDDLRAHADEVRLHADAVKRLVDPFTALYATMTPDQRMAADKVFAEFEHRARAAPHF